MSDLHPDWRISASNLRSSLRFRADEVAKEGAFYLAFRTQPEGHGTTFVETLITEGRGNARQTWLWDAQEGEVAYGEWDDAAHRIRLTKPSPDGGVLEADLLGNLYDATLCRDPSCERKRWASGYCGKHLKRRQRGTSEPMRTGGPKRSKTIRLPIALIEKSKALADSLGISEGEWWRRAGVKATED